MVIWKDETLLQLYPGLKAFKIHRRKKWLLKASLSLHFSLLCFQLIVSCTILSSFMYSRLLQFLSLTPWGQTSAVNSSLYICLTSTHLYAITLYSWLNQLSHVPSTMLIATLQCRIISKSCICLSCVTFVIMSSQNCPLDFGFQTIPSQSKWWCLLLCTNDCTTLLAEQGGLETLGFGIFLSELQLF